MLLIVPASGREHAPVATCCTDAAPRSTVSHLWQMVCTIRLSDRHRPVMPTDTVIDGIYGETSLEAVPHMLNYQHRLPKAVMTRMQRVSERTSPAEVQPWTRCRCRHMCCAAASAGGPTYKTGLCTAAFCLYPLYRPGPGSCVQGLKKCTPVRNLQIANCLHAVRLER